MNSLKYRLSRKNYLILGLLVWFFLSWLQLDANESLAVFITVLSYPLEVIFLALPRARDCGWPRKVAWFTLVPLVNFIPSVALLFMPTKVLFRDYDASGEGASIGSEESAT